MGKELIKSFWSVWLKKIPGLILFIYSLPVYSAGPIELGPNQWSVSGRLGLALLTTELTPGFGVIEKEFTHRTGYAYEIAVSRSFMDHWEAGANLSLSNLTGETTTPDFSAIGNNPDFEGLYDEPIAYETSSFDFTVFGRYYFDRLEKRSTDEIRFDPFFEFGAGINMAITELSYLILPEEASSVVITAKGKKNWPSPDIVPQGNVGVGTRINFYGNWDAIAILNTGIVMTDGLDAVYNYNVDGSRVNGFSWVTKLTVGVIVPFTSPRISRRFSSPWTSS